MKRVVYTAVLGSYEPLVEQSVAASSNCDFICFTDNSEMTSTSWKIRVIAPRFPLDAARSVRQLKIVGNEITQRYDQNLWIDNRIILKRPPEHLFDEWLGSADIGVIRHSARASVEAEYRAVIHKHLDDPARVREQLAFMRAARPAVLREVPHWGAIIARNNVPVIDDAMRLWMDHVLRFSRRDQLSFNYALQASAVQPAVRELDNRTSEWHEWLTTSELPKDKTLRYNNHGYRYPLWTHVFDDLSTNRVSRFLRTRLLGD